ncbi:hypothetical protein ACF3NA_08095 [Alkanindiges sp. WGS2144]|uniref:hypothetical protein n=1 Tax=Alkanindiges sp. WGS2144 TaxID=3366808 RepID=UPI0037530C04
MKDLILKARITSELERMQLPEQLTQKLNDQHKAQEVQLIVNALNSLDQQWH